jgi:hypothetical protein
MLRTKPALESAFERAFGGRRRARRSGPTLLFALLAAAIAVRLGRRRLSVL